MAVSPAKGGSDESGVPEHGGRAQEGAQPQRGGEGRGRAVVRRRGQAREGGGGCGGGRPGGLQGRVGVGRERSSLQVVAERVARGEGARERQA